MMKVVAAIIGLVVAFWVIGLVFKIAAFALHWGLIVGAIALVGYVLFKLFGEKNSST